MRRRLYILATVLSLLCCLVAAALWVRTFWHEDVWRLSRGGNSTWFLVSSSGRLRLLKQGINLTDPTRYMSVDTTTYRGVTIYSLSSPRLGTVGYMKLPIGPPMGYGPAFAGFEFAARDTDVMLITESSTRPVSPFSLLYHALAIPYWFCMLLTAALPVTCLRRRWRQYRRSRIGLCPTCGYDLRATNDRCPECGTPIPQQPVSPT